jgi:hypothetical protein
MDQVLETLSEEDIRLLSKLHLCAKIAFFGIFIDKFLDHMSSYSLKIYQ